MNKNKEELLQFREVTSDELDRRIVGDLEMAASYLTGMARNWQCRRGEHVWDEWNCRLAGNVAESAILGNDNFSYRACRFCVQEMPESRIYLLNKIKEKNAREYEEITRVL